MRTVTSLITLRRALLAGLLSTFALFGAACDSGAGGSGGSGGSGGACTTEADCGATALCVNGECVDIADLGCEQQGCPAGLECQPDGTCAEAAECTTDADCCPGGDACGKTCSEGSCVGSSCTEGSVETCFNGCHKGNRDCVGGSWTSCDALPLRTAEICDNSIDDDCNGLTDDGCVACVDGETRQCESVCGVGVETCADGAWGACDAPLDCACNPAETTTRDCGDCGTEQGTCSDAAVWEWSGSCEGQGSCTPGTQEQQSCGNCGSQTRTCTDSCGWGEWTSCGGEGQCTPEATQETACGECGTQQWFCNSQCTWLEQTECVAGTGCDPGQQQDVACGLCGFKTGICGDDCAYEYGACQDEGQCTPGEQQSQSCGACGTETRTCSDNCVWGPWSGCGAQQCTPGQMEQLDCPSGCGTESRTCTNACTWGAWTGCAVAACSPGQQQTQDCGTSNQGQCQLGSQTRTCTNQCIWGSYGPCNGEIGPTTEKCGNGIDEDCNGSDLESEDDYEPNDSCFSCADLGTDPNVTLFGNVHSSSDGEDWFCFYGEDGLGFGGEQIILSLTNMPPGVDLDLHLYRPDTDVDGCTLESFSCLCNSPLQLAQSITICSAGDGCDSNESITWGEEFLSGDTGWYAIKLQSWDKANCDSNYTLSVNGLN